MSSTLLASDKTENIRTRVIGLVFSQNNIIRPFPVFFLRYNAFKITINAANDKLFILGNGNSSVMTHKLLDFDLSVEYMAEMCKLTSVQSTPYMKKLLHNANHCRKRVNGFQTFLAFLLRTWHYIKPLLSVDDYLFSHHVSV